MPSTAPKSNSHQGSLSTSVCVIEPSFQLPLVLPSTARDESPSWSVEDCDVDLFNARLIFGDGLGVGAGVGVGAGAGVGVGVGTGVGVGACVGVGAGVGAGAGAGLGVGVGEGVGAESGDGVGIGITGAGVGVVMGVAGIRVLFSLVSPPPQAAIIADVATTSAFLVSIGFPSTYVLARNNCVLANFLHESLSGYRIRKCEP